MRNKNIRIFDEFKTRTPGVWYFVPKNNNKYKNNKPCYGFGSIKYLEGSIYTGEIYFDGKNYNKLGNGQQDFSCSTLGEIDPFINERKYLYVGKFDYRKTDWIYGNGVLYYKDLDGKPSRFVKGFFAGLDLLKPYQGEFDYSSLVDGYSKEQESDYNPRKHLFMKEYENYNEITSLENLFIGDSYFEFWYYDKFSGITFKNLYNPKHDLNLGLGGTKFIDWFEYIPLLKDLKEPKNIIINLGFNDLHSNYSPRKVYSDFKKALNMLKEYFPNSNYYLLNIVNSPAFPNYLEKENELNRMMEKHQRDNNITIIHNSERINEIQVNENCFDEDGVHLNPLGYEIMKKEIDKNIKK